MGNAGWSLAEDRQKDGVGYDLEFKKGTRQLNVEVKGIPGSLIVFNLTPKEFWMAEHDPAWVLIAVTSVLSPEKFLLTLVTRDRVVAAHRVISGYRVSVSE